MRRFALIALRAVAASIALIALPVLASPGPQPVPMPPALPVAVDAPYPGVIALEIDARDTQRRIVHVRERVPVAPGPLVLLYPEWVPGAHRPLNTAEPLAGLVISASGRPLAWRRDAVEMNAFHIDVPDGAKALDIAFDVVTPTAPAQGRVTIIDEIAHLQFQSLLLYPAGHFARGITVAPSVTVPPGWTLGGGLEPSATNGDTTRYAPTDLETLIDSPLMAGRWFRRIVLDDGPRPVRLNVFGETGDTLAATDAQVALLKAMVVQADRLFGGARPFDHYDFLVALSDTLGNLGRERHRSTEIVVTPDLFTGWDRSAARRGVLPHEYAHAWNGKYRRPADNWTADFNTPIRNSLLWVYEGQTTYWTTVLSARAGLLTRTQALDALALTVASLEATPGRTWRSVADTTNDPQIKNRRPQPWASWQRGEEYYTEGALIWLDADTLIREGSAGKRSLDDFARNFFGGSDGVPATRTYVLADVVAALNRVQPYDWAGFFAARVEGHDALPFDGFARGGYRLAWAATPTDYQKAADTAAKRNDFNWSIGVIVDTKDGSLASVRWGSPAFAAGLTASAQLIAVGGTPYTPEVLAAAIQAAAKGAPLSLIVKQGGRLGTVEIAWRGGLRYPRLERIPGTAPRLDDILSPRT